MLILYIKYVGRVRVMSSRRQRNIPPDPDRNQNTSGNNNNKGNSNNNSNGNSNQPDLNNLGQLLNNIDLNQVMGQLSQMNNGSGSQSPPQTQGQGSKDPRLDLLNAMKPFLNTRRGGMIDKVGQFYSIMRIVQGNNKKR